MNVAPSRRSTGARLAAGLAVLAVLAVAGCGASRGPAAAPPRAQPGGPALGLLAPRAAPVSWRQARLPGGTALMAYPPAMHLLSGDPGTVSAAQLTSAGVFSGFLNATPRQGAETLANWPGFRQGHELRDDDSSARILGSARGVAFLGGTGSCVLDTYVTRVKANRYTEIACLVQGRLGESVIVAAAPAADWAAAAGRLRRAIAAYVAR